MLVLVAGQHMLQEPFPHHDLQLTVSIAPGTLRSTAAGSCAMVLKHGCGAGSGVLVLQAMAVDERGSEVAGSVQHVRFSV
mmetsp:Transcript_61566/g.144824  ORF Transcript_61566/g.144824 Transcript_61566/m.144824 type:complete len:80 (+) Transcript_61566:26-265(+)|eukprot:697477-Rhodomonas_salina.3